MVFQDPILAGETLVRDSIRSENYSAGVAGWRIARNGDAELNNVTARGSVIVGPDNGFGQIRIEVIANNGVISLKPGGATVATNGRLLAQELSIGAGIPPNVLRTLLAGATDGADVSLDLRKIVGGASTALITADTTSLTGDLTVAGSVTAGGKPLLANASSIDYQATPALNTNSATFTPMIGVSTISFTKQKSAALTRLRVWLSTSAFSSVAAHPVEYAINVDNGAGFSTDYACAGLYFNTASVHVPVSGSRRLAGIAAGAYTLTVKWRSPDSTQFNTDANDRISVMVDEVAV